jgi:hypothetical protein
MQPQIIKLTRKLRPGFKHGGVHSSPDRRQTSTQLFILMLPYIHHTSPSSRNHLQLCASSIYTMPAIFWHCSCEFCLLFHTIFFVEHFNLMNPMLIENICKFPSTFFVRFYSECFQVLTRLTTVTHQTGEYKLDLGVFGCIWVYLGVFG